MTRPISDQARLDFALTLRRRWADSLYPQLRSEYDSARSSGISTESIGSVATIIHALPSYGSFAWLERGAQKLLWRAVSDAIEHEVPANEAPTGDSTLILDPHLALPGWYTDWDIHLQPGGVWSSERAALVYELGAKLVMLGENDEYQFHQLFAANGVPQRAYRFIVDLGCGFGKSTWPFKQVYPEAEVTGVDLAAPCLRLAIRRANERGLRIHFKQANVTATGLDAQIADLVTSTMLLHELPLDVLPDLFKEAARLLLPGGLLRFLDFQYTGDKFRDLAMTEHGSRNNEPYIAPMMAADIRGMARAAGFRDIHWRAFDERGQGLLKGLSWPDRNEWHFPWAVLEAEQPE